LSKKIGKTGEIKFYIIRKIENRYNMLRNMKKYLKRKIKEFFCIEEVRKEEDRFLVLREARKELKQTADNMINLFVKKQINELIISESVRKEGEIKFIYTYPLIIVKSGTNEHEPMPFSEETTSLCFEINEPAWWPPSGRKHLMRISIPSTILYAQKEVGGDLHRDIINAIYQHCLYEKKAKDENKKLIDWKDGPFDNQLDETILVKLWTHILDTMGGTSAEIHAARIKSTQRFLTMVALIIAALTFALRFILLPILEFFLN